MRKRIIIIPIDSIVALFKDYLGQDVIPRNAMPVKLQYNPALSGMFAVVVDSPDIPRDAPAAVANFKLKRMFAVGGK